MPKRARCAADDPQASPQASKQTVHNFQDVPHDVFTLRTIQLQDYRPCPEEVTLWRRSWANRDLYNVRLVGDAQDPDSWVPVAAKDLVCHSEWAASMLELDSLRGDMILPVRSTPDVVKKVIKAIYTGALEISSDVQQLLKLADALLVRLLLCHRQTGI